MDSVLLRSARACPPLSGRRFVCAPGDAGDVRTGRARKSGMRHGRRWDSRFAARRNYSPRSGRLGHGESGHDVFGSRLLPPRRQAVNSRTDHHSRCDAFSMHPVAGLHAAGGGRRPGVPGDGRPGPAGTRDPVPGNRRPRGTAVDGRAHRRPVGAHRRPGAGRRPHGRGRRQRRVRLGTRWADLHPSRVPRRQRHHARRRVPGRRRRARVPGRLRL